MGLKSTWSDPAKFPPTRSYIGPPNDTREEALGNDKDRGPTFFENPASFPPVGSGGFAVG